MITVQLRLARKLAMAVLEDPPDEECRDWAESVLAAWRESLGREPTARDMEALDA